MPGCKFNEFVKLHLSLLITQIYASFFLQNNNKNKSARWKYKAQFCTIKDEDSIYLIL